jgi:hypothetical protein
MIHYLLENIFFSLGTKCPGRIRIYIRIRRDPLLIGLLDPGPKDRTLAPRIQISMKYLRILNTGRKASRAPIYKMAISGKASRAPIKRTASRGKVSRAPIYRTAFSRKTIRRTAIIGKTSRAPINRTAIAGKAS